MARHEAAPRATLLILDSPGLPDARPVELRVGDLGFRERRLERVDRAIVWVDPDPQLRARHIVRGYGLEPGLETHRQHQEWQLVVQLRDGFARIRQRRKVLEELPLEE